MELVSYSGYPLIGETNLPGDKSLSHRAALFAALAHGESLIENFLVAGVTQAMLNALSALGVAWELDGTLLCVNGQGLGGLQSPKEALNCGHSATTLRLLAGALAAAGVAAVLDGSPGLRSRPMGRIVEPLRAMGVEIEATGAGTAPLKLAARPAGRFLEPLVYTLPVASAQVKTCLLLAALAAREATVLNEPGPSRDHTERMLRSMGVRVESTVVPSGSLQPEAYATTLLPSHPVSLTPMRLALPGDISAAAFLIVAALISPGSEVVLRSVGLNPFRTGLLDALQAMGADIQVANPSEVSGEPVGDIIVRHSQLRGADISGALVVRMIDEFPAFAVAASFAQGVTTVRDAAELRLKESDRISAICQELRALGVQINETPDGFIVQGGRPLHGGAVQVHGDHRLAMALAVAGLAAQEPVVVQNAEIIAESFPGFVSTLHALGVNVNSNP